MSNQSYDEKVKAILDRVAKGHLSTEEAATLIAAIKPAADAGDTSTADGPGAKEPVAEEGTQDAPRRSSTDWPAAEDLASAGTWSTKQVIESSAPTKVAVAVGIVAEASSEAKPLYEPLS